jgi:hypothetical protein
MAEPLAGIEACVFDACGTLFDFAEAVHAGAGASWETRQPR